MIQAKRLILLSITAEIIDSLLESDDVFLSKYGYKNEGGEYLNPDPEYLHKIRARLLAYPEEYPVAVDQLIILKDSQIVIGTIYFKSLPVDGVSEVGYGMNPKYEGNGYMTEALEAMLDFGKQNGIKKVVADTTVSNVKSQNVLKRNGFVLDSQTENTLWFSKEL